MKSNFETNKYSRSNFNQQTSLSNNNYNNNNKLLKQQRKLPALQNRQKNFDSSNWDDNIEIETRDTDSISDNNNNNSYISSKNYNNSNTQQVYNKKPNSKLYTFYDYINKKQDNPNNEKSKTLLNKKLDSPNNSLYNENYNTNTNNNNNTRAISEEIIELNTPQYNTRDYRDTIKREPIRFSSLTPLPEPRYITMPISSGFGGYTGTTRRKPAPKVSL